MKVRWLGSAAEVRREQLDYIAKRNARAAIEMGDKRRAASRLLGHHPWIGHLGRRAGTWEWVVRGTPFLIVYGIDGDDTVTLLPLFHVAQDQSSVD